MKPLICPQCGGKIIEYSTEHNRAVCGYCSTSFVIAPEKRREKQTVKPNNPPIFEEPAFYYPQTKSNANRFAAIIFTIFGLIVFFVSIAIMTALKQSKTSSASPIYPRSTPYVAASPSPSPKLPGFLLEFGGEGTEQGQFKSADEIAIAANGDIFVADETMRVQRFNGEGKFLDFWEVPSKTENYRRARSIDKLLVNDKNEILVLVGGVILIYDGVSKQPKKTIHFAPNYIQDVALRSDGSMLAILNRGEIEDLLYLNGAGKIMRRIPAFHTNAAEAAVSPAETATAAIRLAVDNAGNIYSAYAFGDLYSYQLSYNREDLVIVHFSPQGKFINKFAPSMTSGIAVDSRDRIYIERENEIVVFSSDGKQLASAPTGHRKLRSFALDKQDNLYFVADKKVIKRAPVL